ncbi:peptidase S8/S53 subtilisin kexin sedolisin [Sulfobacillus acidophilus TPY]|nr:peptidase S8/S53 subtilisin kexin sedolisin [Sulfobacillus acidophilus TPY]
MLTLRQWSQQVVSWLPHTPAYAKTLLHQDFSALATLHGPRTVDVVVDTEKRMAALAAYTAAVSTPGNPLYHHFLSPSAVEARFGPTPADIQSAEAALTAAGWSVTGVAGFIMKATISHPNHAGMPVSPAIWAVSGLLPHGLIRPQATKITTLSAPLANLGFNEPPAVIQQTRDSAGDIISVLSWNPHMASQVPAGLPLNIFVMAQTSIGTPIAISHVDQITDTNSNLGVAGAQAMPGTQNTLWQVPIAGFTAQPAGDIVQIAVTLANGETATANFTLPAITGNATILSPFTPSQVDQVDGWSTFPANTPPVAVLTIGQPPSLADLSATLTQSQWSPPGVTFHYEDGASNNETGTANEYTEAELDLEAVASAAPHSPIEEYVYPDSDPNDPLVGFLTQLTQQTAAKIASLSYGFYGEDPATLSSLMNILTAEGVTVVQASGDQGAWNGGSDPGPAGLSQLEQIPSVLSVGGLDTAAPATLDANGNVVNINGPAIFKAWGGDYMNGLPPAVAQAYTSQNAASSGGYSTTIPVPSWESPFLPANASGFGVPIIAAPAGAPGFSGYQGGQQAIFGGTSLAAPLTAGWLADAETLMGTSQSGMGNINPLLFQTAQAHPSLFTQALWGSNGVYSVTSPSPGSWNPVTGLGMVNWSGLALADATSPASVTPTLSLKAPATTIGQLATLSADINGVSSAKYQFWLKNPANGTWISSGPYSSNAQFQFRPSIAGNWEAVVYALLPQGTTLMANTTLSVSPTGSMVTSLTITTASASPFVNPGQTVTISADGTDTGNQPEYQFWLRGPNDQWRLVQNYSSTESLSLLNLQPGSYAISVYALDAAQVAAHAWNQAYTETTVIYVGSNVAASVPATGSVNQPLTVTGLASDITAAQYQWWIESPSGQWTSSGAYQSSPVWTFTPTQSGTYTLILYAKDPLALATEANAISTRTTVFVQ